MTQTTRFFRICLLSLTIHLSLCPTAWTKDLQGRFGVGYNAEFGSIASGDNVPGISLKYALARDLALEAILSATTAAGGSSVKGLKLFKNVFYETNLNFYFMLGGAYVSTPIASGIQGLGGLGAEFFVPGVESLGFSVETGGSFDNLTGSYALRTIGVSFIDAGVHFYF